MWDNESLAMGDQQDAGTNQGGGGGGGGRVASHHCPISQITPTLP